MPKVSVLAPCYKPGPQHLREALDSLMSQTFQDWELTIVNQPWDEVDIKAEIADYLNNKRVTFIQSDTLRNIGENWNACLPYINAPYVQYLFHDDLWGPTYLEESVKALDANPEAGFCSAYHDYQYEGEVDNQEMCERIQELRRHELSGLHNGKELLEWWLKRGLHPNIIGEPPFVMMRRELVEKIGPFAEDMPQFLDSEYWAKLLAEADFYFITESLGKFRVHPEAASARNQRAGRGLTDRLNCLVQLSKHHDADVARQAGSALKHHLPRLIAKYMTRRRTGIIAKGAGGSDVKKFLMKHPWLTFVSGIRYLVNKKQYEEENQQFELKKVR